MSDVERNKAIARRIFEEIFPSCDVAALAEVTAQDVLDHGRRPDEPEGLEGATRTMLWLSTVFSEQRWEIHGVYGDGDQVAVHATHHGRQTGELMGIPPTGREVAYDYVHMFRFRDGKAIEHRSVRDTMTLMQQLGVIPDRPPVPQAAGAATAG